MLLALPVPVMPTRSQDEFGPRAFSLRVKIPSSDPLIGTFAASACIGRMSAASTTSTNPALRNLLLVACLASWSESRRTGRHSHRIPDHRSSCRSGRPNRGSCRSTPTMTVGGYGPATARLRPTRSGVAATEGAGTPPTGEPIQSRGADYVLSLGSDELDLHRFERLVERGWRRSPRIERRPPPRRFVRRPRSGWRSPTSATSPSRREVAPGGRRSGTARPRARRPTPGHPRSPRPAPGRPRPVREPHPLHLVARAHARLISPPTAAGYRACTRSCSGPAAGRPG